jgi:tripartite-type tricarboxylate transporter receptor subunit TctC
MSAAHVKRAFAVLAGMLAILAGPFLEAASAQQYPTKPIRLIVPYAPGTIELEARALAPTLEKVLGQPVLVETREGGGSTIGANYVAKGSPPDGYTVLYANSVVLTVAPYMRSLPYSTSDLRAVAQSTATPQLLAIRADAPFKTAPELIAYAKQHPGQVKFGSSGTGTAVHLAVEVLSDRTGIKLNHIPFNGLAPAVAAALGGNVDMVSGFPITIMPQVKAGKMLAIAHFDRERSPLVPDVPPLRELGIDTSVEVYVGAFVAKDTPDAVVAKLSDAFRQAVEAPEFQQFSTQRGTSPRYRSASEFARAIEAERLLYSDIITRLRKQ